MRPTSVTHAAALAIGLGACQALELPEIVGKLVARLETRGNYDPHDMSTKIAHEKAERAGEPYGNNEPNNNYEPLDNWDPHGELDNNEPYREQSKARRAHEQSRNVEVRAPKGGSGGGGGGGSSGGSSSGSSGDSGSSSSGSSGGSSSHGGGSSCSKSCGSGQKLCNGGCIPSSGTCCSASSSVEYCRGDDVCRSRTSTLYYCCPESDSSCDFLDTSSYPTVLGSVKYCSSSSGDSESAAAAGHLPAGALAAAGVFAGAANLIL